MGKKTTSISGRICLTILTFSFLKMGIKNGCKNLYIDILTSVRYGVQYEHNKKENFRCFLRIVFPKGILGSFNQRYL